MPIRIQCPACEAVYTVPDAAAGRRVKCKACERPIPVPAAEAIAKEPKAVVAKAVPKLTPVPLVRREPEIEIEEPETVREPTPAKTKEAKKKAKREVKAKQSRRAVKGCLLIALGLLFVGAVVAAYFLYYPLLDRKVPSANLFRQYVSVENSLESTTDDKVKMDLKLKKLAILMTFESNQFTEDQKTQLREHFKGEWPKHGEKVEQVWSRHETFKLEQEKKNNPEKHTPLVPWEAKPDPGFAFVAPETLPKPLNLTMNTEIVYPAIPSAYALVNAGTGPKKNSPPTVIDLATLTAKSILALKEEIYPLQLSSEGDFVECHRADGTSRKTIVDVSTGNTVLETGSVGDQTLQTYFLPKGRFLTLEKSSYSADYDVVFTIHTLADKTKRTFKLPQLTPVTLSPGGRYLACVWHNMRRITLVDLEVGKSKGDIQYSDRYKTNSEIRIAFSPDGKHLAAAFGGESRPKFGAWSMETGAEVTPQFEPAQSVNRFGSMSGPLYLQWVPDNSGLMVAQRLLIDLKGQTLGELPELDPQQPFPRKVLGGNLYTDDRVGGLNKAGKLTLERLSIK